METGGHNRIIIIPDDPAPVESCDTGIDIQVPDTSGSGGSSGGSGGGGITKHNDLSDIQGGDSTNRYHLTKSQWDSIRLSNNPNANNPLLTTDDIDEIANQVAETIHVPTKVSDLENDLGYLTSVTKEDVGLGNVKDVDQTDPSNIQQDATHRFVTDSEITTWNGKQDSLAYTPEDVANKATNLSVINDTLYPTVKLMNDQLTIVKNATVIHPAYTAPTVTITSPQAGTNYEIGQSVSAALTVNYTANDGGTATYQILKGGTLLSSTQTYTDPIVVTSAGVSYQGKATYTGSQPPYKTNNFGDQDPTNAIAPGNITSSAISIRGFYREFWGPVSSTPATSADVRSLASSQLTSGSNPFTLNTGTSLLKFVFWLPTGKTLVSVKDSTSSNADITTQFVSSALSVYDASGTALVSGTLYIMTVAQAYSPSHAFLITTS